MKNQNLKSLMLATVFTLLTAGLALAQPPQQRDQKQTPPEPSEILKKLDTNEDGKISKEDEALIACAKDSLYHAIENIRVGMRFKELSLILETFIRERGYVPLRDFCGHGIGTKPHEEPNIPNYLDGRPNNGPKIKNGMVFCLEPMVCQKGDKHVILDDKFNASIAKSSIYKAAEDLDLEVLKISVKNKHGIVGFEQQIDNVKQIKELSPIEVFEQKCKEEGFEINENREIWDAFNEALQIARDN